MVGKLKSWMFVSVIIVLVELGQLFAHYQWLLLSRVVYGLAVVSLAAMGFHYFYSKRRK